MSFQTRKHSLELQGPRPAPLTVSENSSKIKKSNRRRSPVIIYLQSPKVIHVRPEEFMGTVQQLTGNNNQAAPSRVAAASASTSQNYSYTSTSSVMVDAHDQNMGMGMGISSAAQQTFDYSTGVPDYGAADPGFGIPSTSNFAEYPSFYMNLDHC
ncbi:protein MKS1 [Quercus suber]|uniref:protein MKS1 n=1 Tax=Quercus suber TaxID=58331 RepID=UPI0032DEE883